MMKMCECKVSKRASKKSAAKLLRRARIKTLTLAVALTFSPITLLADDGALHRIDQEVPILLGTSGGNINDSSRRFCYGGTLGALVTNGTSQFILSNNHILARTNAASIGEEIIQPGLIDQSPACFKDSTDAVADLSDFEAILFKSKGSMPDNYVDAAIAQVRSGKVNSNGTIIDIGRISSEPLTPKLALAVKKSGRTSGLTHGTISSINATVNISYGSGKTALFKDQILVTPGSFLASGDSGSLMVEDVETEPRAVGLLFAGSSSVAIANTIGRVLGTFGVEMVGTSSSISWYEKIFAWSKSIFGLKPSYAAAAALPPHVNPAAVDAHKRVQARHEAKLLAIPGVVGVGVGLSEKIHGNPAIEVYVSQSTASLRKAIPPDLEGMEVKIVETGEIVAY
jgi:hypothetical protein